LVGSGGGGGVASTTTVFCVSSTGSVNTVFPYVSDG
jgi:hypothetical protein